MRQELHRLARAFQLHSADHGQSDGAGWKRLTERLAILVEAEGAVIAVQPKPDPISYDKVGALPRRVIVVDVPAVDVAIVRAEIPSSWLGSYYKM